MSTLKIHMEPIAEVREHPNADRMEIAVVKGWEVCTRKGEFKVGDRALFVPVDALIPEKLAETWGVAPYLGRNGRVHAAKLRGVASFGFLVHEDNVPERLESGYNYATVLGITKYEPPPEVINGDCAPNHPLFPMYTEIENIKNFPDAFQPGEMVVATEKIHGRSGRLGLVNIADGEWEWMMGSHTKRKKTDKSCVYGLPYKEAKTGYMATLSVERNAKQVVIFYEVFGSKMQDLTYGRTGVDFAIFDIMIDGKYLDHSELVEICDRFEWPMVHVLYHGPFDKNELAKHVDGKTTMTDNNPHVREGIVIRPVKDRLYKDDEHMFRCIFKWLSIDYLTRKKGTEFH